MYSLEHSDPPEDAHHETCDPNIESKTNITTGQVRQYLLTARRSSFGQAPVGSRFNHHGLQNIAVIYLVTWFLLMVIVITIALEIGTHKLNHFLSNPMWLHWKQMIQRVYSELMILGFVSLALFMLTRAHLPVLIASIYSPNAEKCETEVQELIETAHIALFVVMLLYIVIVVFVIILSRQVASGWEKLEVYAQKDDASSKDCCSWHFAKSLFRYKTIRTDFIRQHRLAPNFDFSRYLKYCIAHVCLEYLTEIKWSGWVFAAFLLLVNWGRMMLLPIETALATGLLVVGVAVVIQGVSLGMYLHIRFIERKVIRKSVPSSHRDDDAILALESGVVGSDEKSPLLKTTGARIKVWSRKKPDELAPQQQASKKDSLKDKSKDKKEKEKEKPSSSSSSKKKDDKKDKEKKDKSKDKKAKSGDKRAESEGLTQPPAELHTTQSAPSIVDTPSQDPRERFKQRPVSFAIPEGAMPDVLEVASKQRRVLDRKGQSGDTQLEEALAFFQSRRKEEDKKLFPFSRPLLLAHLLQLVLLFQAWFTGFTIYFWIFYIPQWYFWVVASLSPVVTLLVFMPSYLPKYVMTTHVRGLTKVDFLDKAWTRQMALERDETSINSGESTPIMSHPH